VPVQQDDSAARLAAIVASSDDAIVGKDLTGRITSWNQAAERLFGYSAAEAIGRNIRIIIPSDRQTEEDYVLAQVRSGAGVSHFETVRRRKDGSLVDISLTVSPIRSPSGEIVGASKIARDISEAKRLRRELEEANRGKDEFLAVLSHELRTPLNTILGYAVMLQRVTLPPEQHAKAASAIERNARALGRLVEAVFDASAMMTGAVRLEIAPCDLSVLIEEVMAALPPSNDSRTRIETKIEPGLMVSGDPNRLRQVLWNVMSNAVKFTREDRVRLTAARNGTHAHVILEDTGIDLLPETIPEALRRFWRDDRPEIRLHGRLGLELALARELLELHGGSIDFSNPDAAEGATVTLRFPLVRG
jgi:PAS domain S-box-containing protein